MKKYFTTGLAILLPIILTVTAVSFLVNFLTKPFLIFVEEWVNQITVLQQPFLFFTSTGLVRLISKISILLSLFACILVIGFLGKLFLIEYLFRLGDALLHYLPFINKIYKACQDVVRSILSSESKSFSQVVLIPFPTTKSLSVGFVSREAIELQSKAHSSQLIPVFVPGTPNPSVGFMLMFKKEDLIFVNMKIDEAMKFVISCGIIIPEFSITPIYCDKVNSPYVPKHPS